MSEHEIGLINVDPNDQQSLIKYLYQTGHFWSPLNVNGHNISEEDLSSLTMQDRVVVDALRSYQDFMAPSLDIFTLEQHNKLSIADGDLGPATKELLKVERCGHPDWPNPNEARGSGSWPFDCYDNGVHSVKYRVNYSGMPEGRDTWKIVRDRVLEAYAKIGLLLIEVEDDSYNIIVSWVSFRGSTIGLAQFNSQSCRDEVFCKLSKRYWPNNEDVMDLWCHELGHNMNLNHTRGGIMNPSIISGGKFNGWTDRDPATRVLKRYFGGEAIPRNMWWWDPQEPPKPEPPQPGPPDVSTILKGSIEVISKGQSLGEFIFVPKPRV